ncbi:MAG: DegV family EDD domain-containing protein [Ruminiclostridium sp.]|nr:DegV family EDD domain-containing protein [Ruminiclostridium sp.]
MSKNSIDITTDSACDLTQQIAEENDIDIIRFYVITESGSFRDFDEITSQNVVEYYENGGEILMTDEPSVEEYAEFFRKHLSHCSELIHIAVSSGVSESYDRAMMALGQLGEDSKRVHVVDSHSLSTGTALLVLKAAEMRNGGSEAKTIVLAIESMREKLNVSFISRNPAQMYRNGLMGRTAERFCDLLHLHPVFSVRHGKVVVSGVGFGNMEKCAVRYIRHGLKHTSDIDTSLLFITHAGFSVGLINEVRAEIDSIVKFDEVSVTDASATIAANCGSQTIGLLYLRKLS